MFEPEITVPENTQGEFTEKDVAVLKQLIVLTKTGLTCGDIKKIQEGTWSLEKALVERKKAIEDEMERMRGSLILAQDLLDNKCEYLSLPTDHYWDVIHQKEEEGEKFLDLDYYEWRLSFNRNVTCPYCGEVQEVDLEDFIWDETSNPDESDNRMGPDMVYSFDSDENFHCEHCGKAFRIEGWIREYPIGAYDSEKVNIGTCDDSQN